MATGLDDLGDRWTLLIIRDLVWYGPARFRDFVFYNEGIPQALLAERLKTLVDQGLIEKDGQVYSANDPDGDLLRLIDGLALFGSRLLGTRVPSLNSIRNLSRRLTSMNGAQLASLEPMDLRVVVEDLSFGVRIGNGSIIITEPDLNAPTVIATPKEFAGLVAGRLDPSDLNISSNRAKVAERLRLLSAAA